MAGSDGTFVDPYLYPGSTVLVNLLDKRTQAELDLVEYRMTFARRQELQSKPVNGNFDLPHCKRYTGDCSKTSMDGQGSCAV
ncbi:hypothetical protein GCM10027416_14480 [Okibacterium endophyticum]